eukprot:CFRG4554T1
MVVETTTDGDYDLYETIVVGIGLGLTVVLLLSQRLEPHACFLYPLVFISLLGGTDVSVILGAFANDTVFTIALLLVIGNGLAKAGLDDFLTRRLLPKTGSIERCIAALCVFIPLLSAFMYNSAVVAVLVPTLIRWAVSHNRGVGKLMIPLSYASVLGGTCTMIGSSTNLVANNISGLDLGIFDITPLGLSVLGFGVMYLMLFSHRLLPENKISLPEDDDGECEDTMSYAVRFEIPENHFLVGKTANEVGLYESAELVLKRVDHNDGTCAFPLRPSTLFRVGNVLTFAGSLERLVSVKSCFGLVKLAADQHQGSSERLFEVVIANMGPSLDTFAAYRDRLRKEYSALILQVYRGGTLIIGNVEQLQLPLLPTDLLIVESDERFLEIAENSSDFSLVVELGIKATRCETCGTKVEAPAAQFWKISVNTAVFASGIILNIFIGQFSRILMGVVVIQVLLKVLTFGGVGSVFVKNAKVLLTIMGALGLAAAMQSSGVTASMASLITDVTADLSELPIYLFFYLTAALLSSIINNNAAVALLLPIVRDSSLAGASYYTQVVFAVLMGSSHSFMLPSGDKTSLMVMGPGRYVTKNYAKTGFPLQIIGFIVTIAVLLFYEARWIFAMASVLIGLSTAAYKYTVTSANDTYVQNLVHKIKRKLNYKFRHNGIIEDSVLKQGAHLEGPALEIEPSAISPKTTSNVNTVYVETSSVQEHVSGNNVQIVHNSDKKTNSICIDTTVVNIDTTSGSGTSSGNASSGSSPPSSDIT